jgi:adenine-specific DNA-methyltransferase
VVAERNTQTVLDFLLPRLQRVVNGNDSGGVTEVTNWIGGGGFELVHVSPRFGTLPERSRPDTLKLCFATLKEVLKPLLHKKKSSSAA